MTSSTLITDYIGSGTHSARPTSPNVPSGATAVYYETDTTNTFAWSGTAWVQINGGGGTGGSIVQSAFSGGNGTGNGSVTLGTAPTHGNILLAFSMGNNGGQTSGWIQIGPSDSGGSRSTVVAYHVVGVSESATQSPFNDGGNRCVALYELTLAAAPNLSVWFSDPNSTSTTITSDIYRSGGFLIGAAQSENDGSFPSSFSGGVVADGTAADGTTCSIAGFHLNSPTVGVQAQSVTVNWATSTQMRVATVFCG